MKKIIFPILMMFAVSCSKLNSEDDPKPPVNIGDVAAVAEMNTRFTWDIFREEVKSKPNENVLISPLSIQTALSMAVNGAGGNTLDEMRNVLHCESCDLDDLNKKLNDLTVLLTEQSGHPSVTVANGYFYDEKRMTLEPDFQTTLQEHYECAFQTEDFDQEQASLNEINGWVKGNTKGKIDRILERITALDVAFLINAIHFKADWSVAFAPEETHKKNFKKSDGSLLYLDFVFADRNVPFAIGSDYMLADLPFRDSTYSLSFVKSSTNSPINPLQFSQSDYEALLDKIQYERAMISFPKMKLAYDNDLIKSLKNLGMSDAFDENRADFKRMGTAARNIFINQIKHKAILEVDEKGAEGAAVTSIGFGITSLPPQLIYDSPYLVVLRHIKTNTVLFVGWVNDPGQ